MVNQYFRCELLDNRPIQGEFSKDGWNWWKMWDGYYDLYGEMIQLPRWMGVWYKQQLTVVKQKCKEFVKVTIQWYCGVIFKKIQGIYFQFSVSFCLSLHIFEFLFHYFLTTNHKKKWGRWWINEPASW
jgi:hypothetical protein